MAAVAMGGVVAYAYWTTAGAGSGSSTVASNFANSLLITNDAPTAANIVPGGSTSVTVHVKNPSGNPGTAFVNSISGVVSLPSPNPANCSAADFTVDTIDTTAANDTIASGATVDYTTTLHFANQATVNQDGCKSVVLSIAWSSN
ncbi:MAG TPA: hypothetical protein VFO23_07890 [Steroidobacteraceae bacterium]|nr:hypothetical protein [Steroidobacteraceae bacterium]